MDLKDIQNLIKFVSKSGVSSVRFKTKDYEIDIKTGGYQEATNFIAQPSMPINPVINTTNIAPEAATNKESVKDEENGKYLVIKSPMIGTFYTKPSPDAEPFVTVGSNINVGSVVCVIEAMKLFNQIESEISGKIVKVLVDDASPVEYDQALFLVDPS